MHHLFGEETYERNQWNAMDGITATELKPTDFHGEFVFGSQLQPFNNWVTASSSLHTNQNWFATF